METSNKYLNEWLQDNVVPLKEDDDSFNITVNSLNNSLNAHYYPNNDDNHIIIVGSFGRKTHTKSTSDHDLLVVLPNEVKQRLDDNTGNIQSQLLSEIKDIVGKRFPKTELHSDGQVLSIQMHKGVIELIPVFERYDGKYDFPDTHNGGSWDITNPLPEINRSDDLRKRYTHYSEVARLIRSWRSYSGIKLKGIVIDSILSSYYEHFNLLFSMAGESTLEIEFFRFLDYISQITDDGFSMIGRTNETYYNEDMTFVNEAKRLFEEYDLCTDEVQKISLYVEIFGKDFPGYIKSEAEEFIENLFDIGIKHTLILDATVEQQGTRTTPLSKYLENKIKLPGRSKKMFFTVNSENAQLPKNVKYYWKVRNVGIEAKRHNERGQIVKAENSDKNHWKETSNFTGDHFVEVYAVDNDVVIGRGRIDVPINTALS